MQNILYNKKMKRLLFLGLIVLILSCGVKVMAGEIKLTSSAFKEGEMIPKNGGKYVI